MFTQTGTRVGPYRFRDTFPTPILLNSAVGRSSSSTATTEVISTIGADLLVVALTYASASPNGIVDGPANTWIGLTGQTSLTWKCQLFYTLKPRTSAIHSVTASSVGSSFPTIALLAFRGLGTFIGQNGNSVATITTIQPGATPLTSNNRMLITIINCSGSPTFSIDSGFTLTYNLATSSFSEALGLGIRFTADSPNPTWTLTASQSASTVIAAFR